MLAYKTKFNKASISLNQNSIHHNAGNDCAKNTYPTLRVLFNKFMNKTSMKRSRYCTIPTPLLLCFQTKTAERFIEICCKFGRPRH